MSDLIAVCPDCGCKLIRDGFFFSEGKRKQRWRCLNPDCDRVISVNPVFVDSESIITNVKLKKENQRLQDTNRIERKAFREYARIENALLEYNDKLIKILKEYKFSEKISPVINNNNGNKGVGIFHLSDLHFNELIDLNINKYDFKIASRRLQKMVYLSKRIFNLFNVKNVLVAMTGDILNSDRRLDELLGQATNRSKATFLAVDILQQVLVDLSSDFNLFVASVSGNESRVKDEIGYKDIVATDNYDFTVFNILRWLFNNSSITFYDDFASEMYVSVGNKNILLVHGDQRVLQNNVERGVIQLIGKWSNRGVTIDFVLFGHLHYARIGDVFARSSSLCGANEYSDFGLQLISRSSQNVHVITDDGSVHSVKLDLQNCSDFNGYNINEMEDVYNPKSASKLVEKKVVFEVVI